MREDKPRARQEVRERAADAAERVGTHPGGTATGAVAGAVAGAASGLAAGPLGSLVGAVSGAAAGAAAGAAPGRGIDDDIDPAPFEAWWREHYASRPYVPAGARYEDYQDAYRYAIRAYARSNRARAWDDEVAHELRSGWPEARGASRMDWAQAEPAVHDAWRRMYDPQAFR
jgi:hypothetical protein